jgi:hypothetical protein
MYTVRSSRNMTWIPAFILGVPHLDGSPGPRTDNLVLRMRESLRDPSTELCLHFASGTFQIEAVLGTTVKLTGVMVQSLAAKHVCGSAPHSATTKPPQVSALWTETSRHKGLYLTGSRSNLSISSHYHRMRFKYHAKLGTT